MIPLKQVLNFSYGYFTKVVKSRLLYHREVYVMNHNTAKLKTEKPGASRQPSSDAVMVYLHPTYSRTARNLAIGQGEKGKKGQKDKAVDAT